MRFFVERQGEDDEGKLSRSTDDLRRQDGTIPPTVDDSAHDVLHDNLVIPSRCADRDEPENEPLYVEDDDEYLFLKVTYGYDIHEVVSKSTYRMRRLSANISNEVQRRRSSVQESIEEALPDTPQGWAALVGCMAAAILGYELRLQQHLTSPPRVYGQVLDGPLAPIYREMTKDPATSILTRTIQPSLVVGTRGLLSSTAAYFKLSPSSNGQKTRAGFRETLTMTGDGATVAVDWELPDGVNVEDVLQEGQAKPRPIIARPVILIVHGINNHAEFGYIRSQMRACTDRGWIAAGFNMRSCGRNVPVTTPRGYTGAYTGDIRCTVQRIAARLDPSSRDACLFLVGHSLGANLITKYLGEEGYSGTLPASVAGGVALGNPLLMHGVKKIVPLFSPIMATGAKTTIIEHWFTLRPMMRGSHSYRNAIWKALMAFSLADFDSAMAPIFVRNDPVYPFTTRIGYESGLEYWEDASSFRHVRHITVPTVQVVAADDFLVFAPFRGRLRYCIENPNVFVVETKCGGHLGWQESPPDQSRLGVLGSSWADVVTCDFVQAVLEQRRRASTANGSMTMSPVPAHPTSNFGGGDLARNQEDGSELLRVQSRL